MKKILASLVLVLMVAPAIFAQGIGGFYDANYTSSTVKDALRLPDDSYVTLKGSIVKRLTSDEYLFSDKTATITVEIDDEKWMGQVVKPGDILEISGEIDKDFRNTKIDVDIIKLVQQK